MMHLLPAGWIEVQLVKLHNRPGDTVEGLHAIRHVRFDFVNPGYQMIAVANLVELLLKRTLRRRI